MIRSSQGKQGWQVIRYLLVGGFNTCFGYGVFVAFALSAISYVALMRATSPARSTCAPIIRASTASPKRSRR